MLAVMTQTSRREQIAENTRAAKARRRVTDAQIATALGLTRSGVNDRMNGNAHWRIEELEALAAFLDITLDALLAEPASSEASA
jgi:transcriptional regulator with XRE-family HTH domain